jgi:hypothetical protein
MTIYGQWLPKTFLTNLMFQDDNAPPHASRQAKLWKETNEIPMLSWPAQSPDFKHHRKCLAVNEEHR